CESKGFARPERTCALTRDCKRTDPREKANVSQRPRACRPPSGMKHPKTPRCRTAYTNATVYMSERNSNKSSPRIVAKEGLLGVQFLRLRRLQAADVKI